MKFSKIIGVSQDPKTKDLIRKAEEKISAIFTELSLSFDNKSLGSQIGGDPLTFQLVYPQPHICDILSIQLDEIKAKEKEIKKRIDNGEIVPEEEQISDDIKSYRKKMKGRVLRTAATDGKNFYWSPEFVVGLDKLGLRIVIQHEANHSYYLHVGRRGARLPRLWNISIDFKVNHLIMEDLRARGIKDHPKVFKDSLGDYILLEEYAQFLKNPFEPPPRLAHLNPTHALRKMADPAYKNPNDDAEPMYFADPVLSDDMKRPENIYEYLLMQIPKCPKCGKLGKYKKPEEYKQLQKKIAENKKQEEQKKKKEDEKKKKEEQKSDKHSHNEKDKDGYICSNHNHKEEKPSSQASSDEEGDDKTCSPAKGKGNDCCDEGCSECGGDDTEYIDPFGAGETIDDHIDGDVNEDELNKRISDAVEVAKRMGGNIPAGLEDELGILSAPKLTWQDLLRNKILKKRNGYGKNDWTRPKTRPMFAGLYSPKKNNIHLTILFACDSSGSMSKDDIAFAVSQMQCVDTKGESFCCFWDTVVDWEHMVKLNKVDTEGLRKLIPRGRGGTNCASVFNEYEEHCGKVDIIIIATDGILYDKELNGVKIPKNTDVLWLITSHNPHFKPPFGRIFHLHNE